MAEIEFDRFDVLTFDCYGTLIDWEAGLLAALREALPEPALRDDELLEEYARHEAEAERGPYRTYREVLAAGLRGVAAREGVELGDDVVARFAESVRGWPAFPDSTEALGRLQERFRLGVITNCDNDLFAGSAERLRVAFDWVVTAEQARAYKPSRRPFELAFETIDVPRERILHVAQSLYHDHVPARELGLTSVWIDRRRDRPGFGATPPAEASPAAAYSTMAAFAVAAASLPIEGGFRPNRRVRSLGQARQEAARQMESSTTENSKREAACHCGQLRLEVHGDPSRVSLCHCLACQRRTGSAFGMQAAFAPQQVQVTGRSSEYARISDEADRKEHTFHFCPDCGSTVYYREPDVVVVMVGAFADPTFPPPVESGYDHRRHPWVELPDSIVSDDGRAAWATIHPLYEAGRYEEAAERGRELLETYPHPRVLFNVACCESLSGRTAEAIEHLRRALDTWEGFREMARQEPDFDPIRGEPAFAELVGR